jgi:phenylalanyl-tRNA synthetase, alpha subunit (EC 6.1.1.20)
MQVLMSLQEEALALFARLDSPHALEEAKARYLGKTGALTEHLKGLGALPHEERKSAGLRSIRSKASWRRRCSNAAKRWSWPSRNGNCAPRFWM